MRSLACTLATLAALAATPACSKILGIDGDVTLGDAGRPPNTVIGHVYIRSQTLTGNMDVPIDLSQAIIQALIPDTTQTLGFRGAIGTGNADGTFTIPDVPDGVTYLLKLTVSYFGEQPSISYFETTAHDIDHHIDIPTRFIPQPAQPSQGTKVSFDVQGMSPFVNGPEGVFSHISAGSLNLGELSEIFAVPNNSRSLTVLRDWNGPLPESALGDDFMALHLRWELVSGLSEQQYGVEKVIDTFMPPGVTIANGTTTSIVGSWVPAGTSRSISLSIARGMFDGGYDGNSVFVGMHMQMQSYPFVNGSITPLRGMAIYGVPVFSADPYFASTFGSTSGPPNDTLVLTYADPYPADWWRVVTIDYPRRRVMQSPNGGNRYIYVSNQRAFSYTGGNPIMLPILQPPANFKVGGKEASAGGAIFFDRAAPVELAWSPVAAAKLYTVLVWSLMNNSDGPIASLSTAQTSIKIPAEVFVGGEFFAFAVSAVRSPADYDAGHLIANGIPSDIAGAVSGRFRLSDHCGNGTVDAGEECDAGGETATCDVDCTRPLCLDGLRNTAAGEACDTAGATTGCDSDCTLPVCGDGHLNRAVEVCDDGNTIDDGNGCSTTCYRNNTCGDGIVESLGGEACDPGVVGQDSATCDRDCTLAQCGDRHLNTAAGEECDDGNTDDTDGCTRMCKTM